MAESVLDCLSTGMKITVGFGLFVVFFSAISAMAASSVIPLGSPAVFPGRQPAAPPEVSGDPGPVADLVPCKFFQIQVKLTLFPMKFRQLEFWQIQFKLVGFPVKFHHLAVFQIQCKLV